MKNIGLVSLITISTQGCIQEEKKPNKQNQQISNYTTCVRQIHNTAANKFDPIIQPQDKKTLELFLRVKKNALSNKNLYIGGNSIERIEEFKDLLSDNIDITQQTSDFIFEELEKCKTYYKSKDPTNQNTRQFAINLGNIYNEKNQTYKKMLDYFTNRRGLEY